MEWLTGAIAPMRLTGEEALKDPVVVNPKVESADRPLKFCRGRKGPPPLQHHPA
jgi:hypothetical protein